MAFLLIVYSLLGEDLTVFLVEASIKEELLMVLRRSADVSFKPKKNRNLTAYFNIGLDGDRSVSSG
jgi:hypothetical protein